jgi:NADP-dependent 3-hydroxy acid dehydrogenase YdfG
VVVPTPTAVNPQAVSHLPACDSRFANKVSKLASRAFHLANRSGRSGRIDNMSTPRHSALAGARARSIAVITGASSGIGAATAGRLATEGFHVVLAARRADRLATLVEQIRSGGGQATAVTADVTSADDVAALAATVADLDGDLTLLVNNAGGARGADPIESASVEDWRWMYEVNVAGTLRVTQALLPALEASGAGTVVVLSSTAGLIVYEGGAGYAAAKHAQTALAETLRLELCGRPVRVIEIDPGMVRTDEFALNRFDGDPQRAEAVYAGVANPLVAEDVADCIAWCATRPQHVNVDRLVVRPLAQAAQHKVHRVL